ncbi:hypothetical protein JCM8208_005575 [Rhodotorula glutinis]
MNLFIIFITIWCACTALCAPDNGQDDTLAVIKLTAEYTSVARVGLDPVVNAVVHNALQNLIANPVALDDLEINVFALVPQFADWLYHQQTLQIKDMSPPLFDIDHLLGALDRVRQDPAVVFNVFADILECALPNYPASLHALSHYGPVEAAGTLRYCRGMQTLIPMILGPSWIYDMRDFAPQCEGPPRTARNERLGITALGRPRRLCEIEQGLMVAFMSSLQTEGFKISVINLGGGIARDLAGAPGLDGVDLISDSVYSKLFGRFVLQSYHPAIMMNTRFPELRTLLLMRLAILIHRLAANWTVKDIFTHAAGLFALDVYDYDTFIGHAGLDPSSILFFASVGYLIKQWIKEHTTGTRSFSGSETADASVVVDAAKVCDAMREMGDVELHGLLVSTGFSDLTEEAVAKGALEAIYDEHRRAIISRFPLTQAHNDLDALSASDIDAASIKLRVKPFVCEEDRCTRRFARRVVLKKHMETHLPEEERARAECTHPGCGASVFARHLSTHLKSHVPLEKREEAELVECPHPGCDAKVRHLGRHLKRHSEKIQCTYPGCEVRVGVLSLTRHLKTHDLKDEPKKVVCAYPGCGATVFAGLMGWGKWAFDVVSAVAGAFKR